MESTQSNMIVGNLCATSPLGMAVVYNLSSAFIIEPQYSEKPEDDAHVPPGTAAPDGSYFERNFKHEDSEITIRWGKCGEEAIVGEITSSASVKLEFATKPGWKNLPSLWSGKDNGLDGLLADRSGGYRNVSIRTCPVPVEIKADHTEDATITLELHPDNPVYLAAGSGELPDFSEIGPAIEDAGIAYENGRFKSEGEWGEFAQAIADSMNYSRTFSTFDNHRAHVVGRGWWIYKHANYNPDFGPYFGWDQFFNGALACLEDPAGAKETVRAHLAYQLPDGYIANCSHWDLPQRDSRAFVTADRSQPPVGSMCVWKMYERWNDLDFLAEVYPKLVRWSEWWFENRDGNENGLLEWGDALGIYSEAKNETGWDDTPHFDGVEMVGTQMSADAVDLNALWSLDSLYLSKIAAKLGKIEEASKHRANHEEMNKRINENLWNEELGIYCSRNWENAEDGRPSFLTRITPMNFYPLACGAATDERAGKVLEWVYNEDKFWGEYMLPTLPFDDPDWAKQHYWQGHIWPPPNFIVWQGLKQYADPERLATYAERSVKLFMNGWNRARICSENYRSDNGEPASHPNYNWGTLFLLIGVEALCDVDDDFNPKPNEKCAIKGNITMRNVPFGGKLYSISLEDGQISISKEES